MSQTQSLDELIGKRAAEFADQVRKAAAIADKEEEIRIEVEKQFAFLQQEAGVKLEGKHEFTVAKGRVDSVYSRVLIEYKNPSSPADRLGPRLDSPGSKKVVEQGAGILVWNRLIFHLTRCSSKNAMRFAKMRHRKLLLETTHQSAWNGRPAKHKRILEQ